MATYSQFNAAVSTALNNKDAQIIADDLTSAKAVKSVVILDETGEPVQLKTTTHTVTITVEDVFYNLTPVV